MPGKQKSPLIELAECLGRLRADNEAAFQALLRVSDSQIELAAAALWQTGEKGDAEARAALAEAELAEARKEIAMLKVQLRISRASGKVAAKGAKHGHGTEVMVKG